MRSGTWERDLAAYIDSVRDAAFEYGVHDCLIFANDAHRAVTGRGFADDVVARAKTARAAHRAYLTALRAISGEDGADLLDERLERCAGVPFRGDIVARRVPKNTTGYALGVVVGNSVAFIGADDGLTFLTYEPTDLAWMTI